MSNNNKEKIYFAAATNLITMVVVIFMGQGGNIINLVQEMFPEKSKNDVIVHLKEFIGGVIEPIKSRLVPNLRELAERNDDKVSDTDIVKVVELSQPNLLQYLVSRRINLDVARKYCKEVYYTFKGQYQFYAIAFMATDSYRPEVKQAFIFACFTGLRLSDMYKLAPIHIFKTPDGKGEYIDMEMQKTEKPVIIPLSEEAKRWLPKPKGITTPFFDIPTTQTVIGRALRKWAEAAGVEKHISFHCSRHTFGTMMLTLGADLFTTSKLMGHTNIQTTEIYAKIVDKKKEEAINLIDGMFK